MIDLTYCKLRLASGSLEVSEQNLQILGDECRSTELDGQDSPPRATETVSPSINSAAQRVSARDTERPQTEPDVPERHPMLRDYALYLRSLGRINIALVVMFVALFTGINKANR
jgi:hypothetical protein